MLPSLLFSLLLGTLIQDVYESLIQKAGKPRNINNIFSFSKELCLLYFSIPPSLMVKLMLTIYIPPCCQCEKYRFLRRTIKMESLFPTRRKIPPTGSYLAWVNRSQSGAESSWASWGQRFTGGRTEGFQGTRLTTGQFRLFKRDRVWREGWDFFEGGCGCAPCQPHPPGRKGPVCSQQWATRRREVNGAREAGPGELGSQNFPGRGEGASFSSGRERCYGVFSVLDDGFRKGRGTRALNWRWLWGTRTAFRVGVRLRAASVSKRLPVLVVRLPDPDNPVGWDLRSQGSGASGGGNIRRRNRGKAVSHCQLPVQSKPKLGERRILTWR